MNKEDIKIGQRIKSLRDFFDVPKGTEGVIDELYSLERENEQNVIEERFTGIMVAWDKPAGILPKNYKEHDGKWTSWTRDGFDIETELKYLEVIK